MKYDVLLLLCIKLNQLKKWKTFSLAASYYSNEKRLCSLREVVEVEKLQMDFLSVSTERFCSMVHYTVPHTQFFVDVEKQ
jgi:hypothetical protein